MRRTALLVLLAALLAAAAVVPPSAAAAPVNVLVDTDIEGDTDDAGALALLHALADRGEVDILGIGIDTNADWGAPAVDAINTYYGRPHLPIGQYRGPGPTLGPVSANYAQTLATQFPNDLRSGANAPEVVRMYRQILAAQADESVTVVALGFLTNLKNLLDSAPDAISPLSGTALVDRKVRSVVIMGGYWPGGGIDEFNFKYDAQAAARVINDWPGRLVVSGLGGSVGTGPRLARETPTSNPVRRAYEIFPGATTPRPSWDQIVALYAVRGTRGLFTEGGATGSARYDAASGRNDYLASPDKDHAWLGQAVSDGALATAIEDLMVAPPAYRPVPDGTYRLVAKHSGKVLDVNLCAPDGRVQQYTWLDNACQKWVLRSVGAGYVRLTQLATGRVLDVRGASQAAGGELMQHPWLDADNQKWGLDAVEAGWYRLVAKHSGQVLDVPSFSTADAVGLWQFPWLGGSNQKWRLERLGA